jgi:very-short-patch-repair endonuclease
MTPRDDGDAGRTTGGSPSDRQPPPPSEAERARWRALGLAKFQDAAYQRYAQGWRSEDSLRASGRAGYAATAARYGRDFAADVLVRSRYDHPTAPEQAMIGVLDALGQREGADYYREYRVAPGVYADFAWPEQQVALEVHGSAHDAEFFLARGLAQREERRAAVYADTGWTVRVVTERQLSEERARTLARVREAVMPPEQGHLW